jgi:hypothetical protein
MEQEVGLNMDSTLFLFAQDVYVIVCMEQEIGLNTDSTQFLFAQDVYVIVW